MMQTSQIVSLGSGLGFVGAGSVVGGTVAGFANAASAQTGDPTYSRTLDDYYNQYYQPFQDSESDATAYDLHKRGVIMLPQATVSRLEEIFKLQLSVPIVEQYLPSTYQHGEQEIKMLVLHDTGNVNGDTAAGNYNFFSTNPSALSNQTTAHAFLDSKQLILTVPRDQSAWHVKGSSNGRVFNSDSYGLELNNLLTQDDVDEQFDNAARYFAQIAIENNLNPQTDIYSHNELTISGNVYGGHVDPTAYLQKWGYDMDKFRDLVADYMK